MPSRANKLLVALLAAPLLLLGGCQSTLANSFPVGTYRPAPKAPTALVALYRDAAPTRPFKVVAQLNVHLEKTFFIPSVFDEALPKLEELARHEGADALTNVQEKKSRLNETFIYNVTADAVVFTQ